MEAKVAGLVDVSAGKVRIRLIDPFQTPKNLVGWKSVQSHSY
jgi:hypothetical protein